MRRRKGSRVRLVLILALLFVTVLTVVVRVQLFPLIDEMARTTVLNEATDIINEAIDEQIGTGAIDYNSIVTLEKDANGGVTALKTNVGEINRLKAQVLGLVNDNIMELSIDELGVPVGNLVFPEFFAGRGFLMPVRIVSVRNSDAAFRNAFSQAGINQTLHQMLMDISVSIMVLTPAGTQNVTATLQVVVAETVIVGTVPDSYMTFDGDGKQNQLE